MSAPKKVSEAFVNATQKLVWEYAPWNKSVPKFDDLNEDELWGKLLTGYRVSVYFERPGWAVSATLYIRFDTKEVTVGWSSTDRNVSNALAAVTLYRQVVELAAQVDAFMQSYRE
jgi:hypothetical protein